MCIALPMKIVEVVDRAERTIRIVPDASTAADWAGEEVVSAALVVEDAEQLDGLVGGWGIVHAGYLLARLDEEDARSRLALFAAMDGAGDPVGLLRPF